MASRRARRSSILKTRYDGGSEELNFDGNGDGGSTTRNLTGLIRRRVSFSHTNQVKEYDKSNSSTEDASMSKTTDLNQTVCDMDMSVYMDDADYEEKENQSRLDVNKTNVGVNDISVYQTMPTASKSRSSSDCFVTDREVEKFNSSTAGSMSKTSCNLNMSVYVEDGTAYEGNQTRDNANKTRVDAADISVYQMPIASVSKPRIDHSVTEREVVTNYSMRKRMSMTTCDYNMSVYEEGGDCGMNDEYNQTSCEPANKTRVADADISVYQYQTSSVATPSKSSTNANHFFTDRQIGIVNSSKRGEMSKTTCDYNMSVYVEKENDCMTYECSGARDKTRVEVADISVYQELSMSSESKPSTDASFTDDREFDKFSTTMRGEKTACNYNMSLYAEGDEDSMDYQDAQINEEADRTRVGAGDISVYQTLPSAQKSRVAQSVSNREIDSVKEVMSKTTGGYNMSVYMEDRDNDINYECNQTRADANKTRIGVADISVYQAMPTASPSSSDRFATDKESDKFNPSTTGVMSNIACDYGMGVHVENGNKGMNHEDNQSGGYENNKTPIEHRQIPINEGTKSAGTLLYFGPTDPQQFLNPLGQGKITANKRKPVQQEQIPKLSFGKFGSAKTPKRNKIPNAIVPESVIVDKSILKNSAVTRADAQTSPMIKDHQDEDTSSSKRRVIEKSVRLVDVQTSPMFHDQKDVGGNKPSVSKKPFAEVEVQTSPFVQNQIIPKPKVVNQTVSQNMSMLEVEKMQSPSKLPKVVRPIADSKISVGRRDSECKGILRTPPEGESKTVEGVKTNLNNASKRNNILQSPPIEQIQSGITEMFKTTANKESFPEIISKTSTPPPIERSRGQGAAFYSPLLHANSISEAFAQTPPMILAPTKIRDLTMQSEPVSPDCPERESTQPLPCMQPSQPLILVEESILQTEKEVVAETVSPTETRDPLLRTEIEDQSILNIAESVPQTQPSSVVKTVQAVVIDQPVEEMKSRDEVMSDTSSQNTPTPQHKEMENPPTPDEEFFEMSVMNPQTFENEEVEPITFVSAVKAPDTPTTDISFVVPKTPVVRKTQKGTTVKPSSSHSEIVIVLQTPLAMEAPKSTTVKPASSHSEIVIVPQTPLEAPRKTIVKPSSSHSDIVRVPQTPVEAPKNTTVKPPSLHSEIVIVPPTPVEAPKKTTLKSSSSHSEIVIVPQTPLEAPKKTTLKSSSSSHSEAVSEPQTSLEGPKNATLKSSSSDSETVTVPKTPSFLEASSSTGDFNVSLARMERGKQTRNTISHTMKPIRDPTTRSSGFLEIQQKLYAYANDSSLDIFEKCNFLIEAHVKLARFTDDEWAEVLKTGKVCKFLGDEFIKAVNIERSRLNDPHPLYQAAMRSITLKKNMKNKIIN